jgi:hypothetical protein
MKHVKLFEQFVNEDLNENLDEARIAIKHVYSNAPVRNKVLELLKSGKISESDFMDAVSKAGAPAKWLQRNSQYFKIEEEDGVKFYSLSKSGETIVNSLQLNEASQFGNRAGLTKEETLKIAQKVADAISKVEGSKCTVNKKSVDEDSFDLDIDGEEYAGGSYNLYDNGNIVNHAIGNAVKEPIYGNWKKDDVNAIAKKIKAIDAQFPPSMDSHNQKLKESLIEISGEYEIDESLVVDPLDITKDFFYVSINGTTYGYQAKAGGNVEDIAKTFKGMLKYSAGKALAWLKKNADLVSGSKKAVNESTEETLTAKDKQWVKSLGNNKIQYNDQQGSEDHSLSAILSLMAGGGLKWGGAADFGFDHVDMYDEESGKTILPDATGDKYTFAQLLAKAKTVVKKK